MINPHEQYLRTSEHCCSTLRLQHAATVLWCAQKKAARWKLPFLTNHKLPTMLSFLLCLTFDRWFSDD